MYITKEQTFGCIYDESNVAFFKLNLQIDNWFCSDNILLLHDFRRPQSNHGHGRGDTARHNHPLTSASR